MFKEWYLMWRNILFDLDGTLTDPKEGITRSIVSAFEKVGFSPPSKEELYECIGPPLLNSFLKILKNDQKAKQAIGYYRERYASLGLFENQIYDGIKTILSRLKKSGFSLYVATSKPTIFAEKIIHHFELQTYFTKIYGSELDGVRSDKGELISFILEQEDIVAKSCVMVGDREHDIYGARKNRLPCIGVSWGYGSLDELKNAGAHAVFSTPEDLYLFLI